MHSIWERIFGSCVGCAARDYHIASLKEQLHTSDLRAQELELRNEQLTNDLSSRLDFVTGRNRIPAEPTKEGMHSVPRRGGIQDRIARAERADREKAEPLVVARRKEYEDRINDILKPETEIVEESSEQEKRDAV